MWVEIPQKCHYASIFVNPKLHNMTAHGLCEVTNGSAYKAMTRWSTEGKNDKSTNTIGKKIPSYS